MNVFNSVLLVIGTCIGGGILALPMALNSSGFAVSVFALILIWIVMTFGAFLILKLSYKTSSKSDYHSLIKQNSTSGTYLLDILYFLLLGAILLSYSRSLIDLINPNFSLSLLIILSIFVMYFLVLANGLNVLTLINRPLVITKLIIFFILIYKFSTSISFENLSHFDINPTKEILPFIVTSFGFAVIVPSFKTNLSYKQAKFVLVLGSSLTLLMYISWIFVFFGNIRYELIINALLKEHSVFSVISLLSSTKETKILVLTFYFICVLTSLNAVGFSLLRFLQDTIKPSARKNYMLAFFVAFTPLVIAYAYQNAFLFGIKSAGFVCFSLLFVVPLVLNLDKKYLKLKNWINIIVFVLAVTSILLGL